MTKRVRPRAPEPRALARVLAALLLVMGGRSLAESRDFPAERLRGVLDGDGIIAVESGIVPAHGAWDAAAWFGWAKNPLVLYRPEDGARAGSLVAHRLGGGLTAAIGVRDVAQLGLEIPFILDQDRAAEIPGVTSTPLAALAPLGAGDVRLAPKLAILRQEKHAVDLAVVAALTIPTGGARDFFGESWATFVPELAVSRRWDALRVAANLSAPVRRRSQLLNQVVESEIAGGLGLAYRMWDRGGAPVELAASLNGAVAASAPFAEPNQTPLEARTQASWRISDALVASVGAGAGLSPGWGTPDWRVFSGLRYSARRVDRDGDGRDDSADACPAVPEDPDGFDDDDGCPDPDDDRDGLADAKDACPREPEDADGFEDGDGCVDADDDRDGIADAKDACVREPEDADGRGDEDGCPDPDDDSDGVPDVADLCPVGAGPAANRGCPDLDGDGDALVDRLDGCPGEAGPEANRGCPERDRDSDAVVDRLDNCPDEPGTAANHGCRQRQLVVITAKVLEIADSVYFKLDKDEIDRRSFALLENVARVISAHPEIERVEIEGHTDAQGKGAYNLELSQRRAEAVLRFLVAKGVAPARLAAKGFGDTKPIGDNRTAMGRAKNRRVVFTIAGAPAAGVDVRPNAPEADMLEAR